MKTNKAEAVALLKDQGAILEFLASLRLKDKSLKGMNGRITILESNDPELANALNRIHDALLQWLSLPKEPCKCGCVWYWRDFESAWHCWHCHFFAIPVNPSVSRYPLVNYCTRDQTIAVTEVRNEKGIGLQWFQ